MNEEHLKPADVHTIRDRKPPNDGGDNEPRDDKAKSSDAAKEASRADDTIV